ncbi:MAG: bifunctional hydroxymethylpyrimidine kinase/phosphomethylpyrimidine kinase [Ahrensia sp.]|nr:bifunctional hydroxymethylpyrimidine kinase/phosphomethylpyrimidine kinase [Ahrensia sp.]
MTATALTIAGSDSGGGAGIQADLKTFSALGVYGTSVITALTAQNTRGVSAIHDVPADFVEAQLAAVFDDIVVDAVKIGMLSQPDIIAAVADGVRDYEPDFVVLDPVMVAESGDALIADIAVASLVEKLFPLADLITPNLHEAARLLDTDIATDRDEMEEQVGALIDLGAHAVLLKGGHAQGKKAEDLLLTREGLLQWFTSPFVKTKNTHGTGCTLSSAIAARMALGDELEEAMSFAKTWLSKAIAASDTLDIGEGAGPVHHFHAIWKD